MACYFNDKKVLPLADFSQTDSFDSRRTANGEKILSPSFALVEKIKGKTVKSTNLIPFPYYAPTGDASGLDYVSNSDGSITINGTMTRDSSAYIFAKNLDLEVGKTYTYSTVFSESVSMYGNVQMYNNGSFVRNVAKTEHGRLATFTVTEDMVSNGNYIQVNLYSYAGTGATFEDVVVYPMLNEGTTAQPYTPYFAGLKNATISGIKSTGANLIPYPYSDPRISAYGGTFTEQGLTWTVNEDRSITVVGTVTGPSRIMLSTKIPVQKGKTYAFSMSDKSFLSLQLSLDLIGTNSDGTTTTVANWSLLNNYLLLSITGDYENFVSISIAIKRRANDVEVNATLYPMLVQDDAALPYQPYTENTYQLPESYELGEWDSINPIEKTITRGTRTITFNGTETFTDYISSYGQILFHLKEYMNPSFSSCISNFQNGVVRGDSNGGTIAFRVDKTSTLEEFKEFLSNRYESGDPITVSYPLATVTMETVEDLPRGYTAHKDGTETYLAGETDNSEWGAIPEFTLNYPKIMKEGTFNG